MSCVVVTRGRAPLLAQSVRYFLEQDYPRRELVLVHEEQEDLPASLPEAPWLRRVRVCPGMSLGEKRNVGAREARGEVVAQWDDDDWYGPGRLSAQVAPLLAGRADISGLRGAPLLVLHDWSFWRCAPEVHARLFVQDVLGGTLVFWREVWERRARYPHTWLREDADFLLAALQAGARLERVEARGLFIYVRHGANTWRFQPREVGWTPAPEPDCLAPARAFYRERAAEASAPRREGAAPRVSCIMPTHQRRAFVPRAIRYFLAQDYPDAELLILDDGADSVEELVPREPRIRYVRLPRRLSVGHKRNLACEDARGELILHWDDDDWMGPRWVRLQVEALLGSGADACGLSQPYFYEPARRQAWRYLYPASGPAWVHGGTLCYTRALWRRNPFPDAQQGEDVRFLWSPQPKRVVAHAHATQYVALLHTRNTSARARPGPRWRRCPAEEVERLFLAAR